MAFLVYLLALCFQVNANTLNKSLILKKECETDEKLESCLARKEEYKKECEGNQASACFFLGNTEANNPESTPIYKKACDLGYMAGCGSYGRALSSNPDPKLRAIGITYRKKSCDANVALDCGMLGLTLQRQSPTDAYLYHKKACDLPSPKYIQMDTCFNFSSFLLETSKKDEAILYFKKSCDLGRPDSCAKLVQLKK